MTESTIGEKIRTFRKQKGWTQKKLGEKCGINEANIRKYELGTQNPKKETLKRIAEALNVSLLDLGIMSSEFLIALNTFQDEGIERFILHSNEETERILDCFELLNSDGQKRVVQYAEDLSKISEYQKKED